MLRSNTMQNIEPMVIKAREDLEYLLSKHTIHFFPRRHPRIILQFDNLTTAENESWARKINLSYYACGCSEGALFLFVGLIGYLVCLFLVFWGAISYLNILGGLLFLFLLSGVGKFFGMLRGKIRLKYLANKLSKLV